MKRVILAVVLVAGSQCAAGVESFLIGTQLLDRKRNVNRTGLPRDYFDFSE